MTYRFGFMTGRSSLSQLVTVFHDWAQNKNNGLATDVLFLDFSKAFDSVPHKHLFLRLRAYGTRDPPLSRVRSYSSWTRALFGVPQGTVLGPILFLIDVNDLTRNIESKRKLFADDIKVYKVLRNVHEDTKSYKTI